MAKKAKARKAAPKAKAKPKTAGRKAVKKPAPKKAAPKKAPSRKAAPAARKRPPAPPKPAQPKGLSPGYRWVNAYLTVSEVEPAIDFYQKGFGFKLKGAVPGPDGKLNHAELLHNDSVIMVGPPNPNLGAVVPPGQSPVILYTYVENVDELAARAAQAGGRVVQEPKDQMWGDRCCLIIDPAGHTWMFATYQKDVSFQEMTQIQQQGQPPSM